MHPVSQSPMTSRPNRGAQRARGFTLVELMVVVGIIGLLIAILVPGIGAVQSKAKATATSALFSTLDTGITQYRGEDGLGGVIPPSASDSERDMTGSGNYGEISTMLPAGPPTPVANPPGTPNPVVPISGANLLVYAMAGRDFLGTPGFPDTDNDSFWWDDVWGAHAIDSMTIEPLTRRFEPFVSQATLDTITTLRELEDNGSIEPTTGLEDVLDEPFFTDKWDRPVLYYKARTSARQMIYNPAGSSPTIGVYDHRDNQVFTGSDLGSIPNGVNFGAGTGHRIATANQGVPLPMPDPTTTIKPDSFASFIHDASVTARHEPVNRETYLLISAGQDGLYGTADDITNWTRN